MKNYNLDSIFTFGKFKGKTVKEVIELQPSYLDWCLKSIDSFSISENVITEIKANKPDFTFSSEALQKISIKNVKQQLTEETTRNSDYDSTDYSDFADSSDWNHYDDSLDMDQQSVEFWNQF